jgi:hypothetical protein
MSQGKGGQKAPSNREYRETTGSMKSWRSGGGCLQLTQMFKVIRCLAYHSVGFDWLPGKYREASDRLPALAGKRA